jgi:hypothetical protein
MTCIRASFDFGGTVGARAKLPRTGGNRHDQAYASCNGHTGKSSELLATESNPHRRNRRTAPLRGAIQKKPAPLMLAEPISPLTDFESMRSAFSRSLREIRAAGIAARYVTVVRRITVARRITVNWTIAVRRPVAVVAAVIRVAISGIAAIVVGSRERRSGERANS